MTVGILHGESPIIICLHEKESASPRVPTTANLPRALPPQRTTAKAARFIRRGVAFGSLMIASSVWLALRCVHAGEAETLQLGQARQAPLRAGQRHAYPLPLAQRDCAFGKLDAHAGTVLLRVLALESRQRELRQFTARAGQTQPIEFEFCVEAAGTYELELTTPDGHARYELQLEAILGRNSRSPAQWATLANTLANPSSPRLRTLQAELLVHPHDTADFWREVDASGTPLREPIDRTTTLVTFLYRAGPPVEHVAIDWGMWTSTFAQREFSRLPESDVWWRSVTLPNATRLSYQLAIDAPRDPSPEHALADRAVRAVARADPRNESLLQPRADLDAFGQRSLLTLSAAPAELTVADQPQPWPRSRLQTLTVGSDAKHNAHRVSVFLP
ncbi:MAG: enterochelin esterase, partial [Pseudomonadota bacterium]